jgi:epoxyqueuosine reductase
MSSPVQIEKNTEWVKSLAHELGFISCGIARAEFLEEEAPRLESWLNRNFHGEMSYMDNHFDLRLDPTKLVPGARTVVSLLLNYYPEEQQRADAPKISKYAYGRDYHKVIKKRLKEMLSRMKEELGDFDGRAFVDSAPVMDKAWAANSGLGWIGKHSNLISKQRGSFFFIAELIIDLELKPDTPVADHCGSCTRCIDACPTEAISPYEVDGSRCISYLTIELKGSIPAEFKGKMDDWIFGCDICQDVCPWNRFSIHHQENDFKPSERLLGMSRMEWMEISEEVFEELFHGSAVKRTGFEGLKRNLEFMTDTE